MDPSHSQGAPADQHPISDDAPTNRATTNRATANSFRVQIPDTPYGVSTIIPARGLSPPPESDYTHNHFDSFLAAPWTAYQQGGEATQPPTPPRQEDEFSLLRQWYAQNEQQNQLGYTQPPSLLPDNIAHFGTTYTTPYSAYNYGNLQGDPIGQFHHQPIPPQQLPSIGLFPPPVHSRYTLPPEAVPQEPAPAALLDTEMLQKQEKYRKKGEARRRSRSSHNAAKPRKASGVKRKAGPIINTPVPPTPPPPLRHPRAPDYHLFPESQHAYFDPMDWEGQQQDSMPNTFGVPTWYPASQDTPLLPELQPQLNRDDIAQPITNKYEEYKWSVKLYEVQCQYYDFAQSFVEDLFLKNLPSHTQYKWHAHTTTGFIKDGGRLSILVLHNAANPFTWGPAPESTTTIGVYGRYWHTQDEIHWKTFSPGIPDILKSCVDQGYIGERRKWDIDMEKASDKRFHRAYWLAANMLPLKGLLNHGLSDSKPHDALEEEMDDEFEISEDDLQCAWENEDISYEEAAKVWKDVLEELEMVDVPDGVYEHIATGGSERDLSD